MSATSAGSIPEFYATDADIKYRLLVDYSDKLVNVKEGTEASGSLGQLIADRYAESGQEHFLVRAFNALLNFFSIGTSSTKDRVERVIKHLTELSDEKLVQKIKKVAKDTGLVCLKGEAGSDLFQKYIRAKSVKYALPTLKALFLNSDNHSKYGLKPLNSKQFRSFVTNLAISTDKDAFNNKIMNLFPLAKTNETINKFSDVLYLKIHRSNPLIPNEEVDQAERKRQLNIQLLKPLLEKDFKVQIDENKEKKTNSNITDENIKSVKDIVSKVSKEECLAIFADNEDPLGSHRMTEQIIIGNETFPCSQAVMQDMDRSVPGFSVGNSEGEVKYNLLEIPAATDNINIEEQERQRRLKNIYSAIINTTKEANLQMQLSDAATGSLYEWLVNSLSQSMKGQISSKMLEHNPFFRMDQDIPIEVEIITDYNNQKILITHIECYEEQFFSNIQVEKTGIKFFCKSTLELSLSADKNRFEATNTSFNILV